MYANWRKLKGWNSKESQIPDFFKKILNPLMSKIQKWLDKFWKSYSKLSYIFLEILNLEVFVTSFWKSWTWSVCDHFEALSIKRCVRYILASLFSMSKREHLRNQEISAIFLR